MALIDKASLLMVPSTYEAGKLYNVLPSGNRAPDSTDQNSGYDQTRADFDFDRGSNTAATRIGSDGLLKKYRENELLQSNQFDTTWYNTTSSETSGQSGYDGTNNAWKLSISAAAGRLTQSVSLSGVQTLSVYAKADTYNFLDLYAIGNVAHAAYFDLSTGSVGTTFSLIDSNIESVGDGWYRCSITFNDTTLNARFYPAVADNDLTGTSGSIFIQNAQLESGLVSTDYLDSTSVTGKAGVLVDLPRINYDANGENGSLLLEPSRQQLLPYSEWIGGWAIVNDATIDGVQSFTLGSTGARIQAGSIGSPSGDFVFYAVFDSADIGKTIKLSYYDATASTWVFGNDITIDSNGRAERLISTGSNVIGNVAFYGTSTSQSFTLKYCQFEAGSYPSSYIPNHGESGGVTRAADYMSTTPTDLLGSTTGSWFMEMDDMTFEVTGTSVPTIYLGDDTQNCLALEGRNSGNNKVIYLVKEEGGTVTTLHAFTISGKTKFCFVWSGTTLKVFRDGTEEYSSTSFTQPTNWDTFVFNHSGREAFSEIANIQLYDTALSDSEAQTLTTL